MKTTCTLLLCILGLTGWTQEKETLSFNLTKGSTYTLTVESTNVLSQKMMGQSMLINVGVHFDLSYFVKEKNPAGYEIEACYTRLSMNLSFLQETKTITSDDKEDPVGRILASLVNMPIRVKTDARGKVSEVDGVDAMLDALVETAPMLSGQFKNSFGDKALKQNFEATLVPLPDYPVAVGDTWTQEFTQDIMIPVKSSATYTFLGEEKGLWKIGSSATLEIASDGFIEMNGVQMKSNMTGSTTGELKLDKKTGWVETSTMTVNLKGENVVKANEQIPQDMTIYMELESKTTTSGSTKK
jgi:hypothetical protein